VHSLEAHRMTGMPFQRPLSEDTSAVCAFESSLGVRKEASLKALAEGDQYEICTQTASETGTTPILKAERAELCLQ
jgi:hypothetical protein